MDKLACALKDVPQSIIAQIVNEQLKRRVKDFLEDGPNSKTFDAMVEKMITDYCKKQAKKIVVAYLDKAGQKMIEDAVEQAIENDGLPDDAYNAVLNGIDSFVKSKFKTKGE
jgi:hypothetical protein